MKEVPNSKHNRSTMGISTLKRRERIILNIVALDDSCKSYKQYSKHFVTDVQHPMVIW